eukprot:1563767-Alexandrium_andersonii.AAC.1
MHTRWRMLARQPRSAARPTDTSGRQIHEHAPLIQAHTTTSVDRPRSKIRPMETELPRPTATTR